MLCYHLIIHCLISVRIWRRVSGDTIIGQYDIPANTAILIPVNIIHADIDYFFEPELFEPER